MFSLMYPQLQDIDFRTDVRRLEVPVYVLDGEHELRGRRELAHEWFEALTAPSKKLVTYGDAGHAVAFEELDAFRRLLVEEIVPATYEAGSPRQDPDFGKPARAVSQPAFVPTSVAGRAGRTIRGCTSTSRRPA